MGGHGPQSVLVTDDIGEIGRCGLMMRVAGPGAGLIEGRIARAARRFASLRVDAVRPADDTTFGIVSPGTDPLTATVGLTGRVPEFPAGSITGRRCPGRGGPGPGPGPGGRLIHAAGCDSGPLRHSKPISGSQPSSVRRQDQARHDVRVTVTGTASAAHWQGAVTVMK